MVPKDVEMVLPDTDIGYVPVYVVPEDVATQLGAPLLQPRT